MDDQEEQQANHDPVINIKNEPISDGIEFENNPWNVESLQAFLCLKCPQCVFDTKEKDSFQNHAIENHPLSTVLFAKKFKEEKDFDKKFNNLADHFLADRIDDSEDVQWEPDYLDYCESKLEEYDDEVDYDYDYEYEEIKKERRPKVPKIKKEPEPKIQKCPICQVDFSHPGHLNRHIVNMHKGMTPFQCCIYSSPVAKGHMICSPFTRSETNYEIEIPNFSYSNDQGLVFITALL